MSTCFEDHDAIYAAGVKAGRRIEQQASADLAALRADGWFVAVHNDYKQNGKLMTFWLFTHPSGRWIKGEGETDAIALSEAATQLQRSVIDNLKP